MRAVVEVSAAGLAEVIGRAEGPAVARGAVAGWPLAAAALAGDRPFVHRLLAELPAATRVEHARLAPGHGGCFHYGPDGRALNFQRGAGPLGAFLAELLAAPAGGDALAVQGLPLDRLAPGFARGHPAPPLPAAAAPRAWIGNRATVATHNDPLSNLACVVAGRRRFTLFPPEQVGNLYMGPFHVTPAGTPVSMVRVTDPDLGRYPRFERALAAAETAELAPGDAIFIPYGWFHHVEALAPVNMLVNYWWNAARADLGSPWDALMHGMAALRSLPPDQRRLWRAMFDHYVFLADGDPGAHLDPAVRGILAADAPAQLAQLRRQVAAALARDGAGPAG